MNEKSLDRLYSLAREAEKEMHQEDRIVKLLQPYLEKRPEHGMAWMVYAEALLGLARATDGMYALKKALALAPSDEKPYVYARMGLLCAEFRSREEAKKFYELATDGASTVLASWVWTLKGVNLANMEHFESAVCCIKKAIANASDDKDEVLYNLAIIYRTMGKLDESIEVLRELMNLNPEYLEAKLLLSNLEKIDNTTREIESLQ